MSTESLIKKIRALRRKAEDPSVTEAEAMAFMSKVQELLAQHSLSITDIDIDESAEDKVRQTSMDEVWHSPARRMVLRAVCELYMCRAIGPARGSRPRVWTIVGRPSNVTVAVEMTDYLIKTTVRLSKRYVRENPGADGIDFRRGCMARLVERVMILVMEQRKAKPEYRPDGNPGNLPALYESERSLIQNEMAKMSLRRSKVSPLREGADARAGRRAAEDIGLHTQVGGGGGRLMIGG